MPLSMAGSIGARAGDRRGPPPPAPSSGIVSSDLFVHLDASNSSSYPGSGTTWTDLTGNGNNGILTNGATYSASAGGCIDLDGTNDHIAITHTAGLSAKTNASITLSIWIRLDVLAGMSIFGKLTNVYAYDGYIVGISSTGLMNATTNGTGIDKTHVTATSQFTSGVWYFVTFITRISATANSTKMYVGTTLAYQGAHGTDGYSESNTLRVGGGYSEGATVTSTINGQIGAFYFYTRELSASEITQNYDATKSRYGY